MRILWHRPCLPKLSAAPCAVCGMPEIATALCERSPEPWFIRTLLRFVGFQHEIHSQSGLSHHGFDGPVHASRGASVSRLSVKGPSGINNSLAYQPTKGSVPSFVLAWLIADRTGGDFSASEVATALDLPQSLVHEALDRLAKHGLITKIEPRAERMHGARFRARTPRTQDSGSRNAMDQLSQATRTD